MKNKIIETLIAAEKFHNNIEENANKRLISEKADVVTEADMEIGDFIIGKLLDSQYAITVESEEYGKQRNFNNGNEDIYIAIDDIDGSNNLRVGEGVLPYCSMIVAFKKDGQEENLYKFSDYRHAACIDYVSKRIFYTEKGLGRVEQYDLMGNRQKSSDKNMQNNSGLALTLSADIVSSQRGGTVGYAALSNHAVAVVPSVLDGVYKNFAIVDSGCSVFEYAMIGMGIRNGYVSSGKKMHELPLLYAFCKETGKQLMDFEMNSYDEMIYDFNGKDATVIAGDENLIEQVHTLIETQQKRNKQMLRILSELASKEQNIKDVNDDELNIY